MAFVASGSGLPLLQQGSDALQVAAVLVVLPNIGAYSESL